MDLRHIIGARIATVRYSEVNSPDRRFYFDGFDTVDCGVHIGMANGHWWNFRWTDDELFEVDEGLHTHTEYLEAGQVKTWDATERWAACTGQEVREVLLTHFDEGSGLVERCTLVFANGARVVVLVAEELYPGTERPKDVGYDSQGHLYIFHDQRLLAELESGG